MKFVGLFLIISLFCGCTNLSDFHHHDPYPHYLGLVTMDKILYEAYQNKDGAIYYLIYIPR